MHLKRGTGVICLLGEAAAPMVIHASAPTVMLASVARDTFRAT